MLHCNMKRKRQRCAKLPRFFDASIVAPIAIARLDTPQACNWRDGRRPGRAGDGGRSPRILLIFH
jgi:hypothetical protein